MTRTRLTAVVAAGMLVAVTAACSPAGRYAYTGSDSATTRGGIPPGYRNSLGRLVLTPLSFPFVRCPGRVKTQLAGWGPTGYWNRVGNSIAEGVKRQRKILVVLRSSSEGSFGRAVVCSRRRTDGKLRLTVDLGLRALSPSRVFVTIESVAAWNVGFVKASRSVVVDGRWRSLTLSGRLDPRQPWYAVYVVSRGREPFFVRRPVLRLTR